MLSLNKNETLSLTKNGSPLTQVRLDLEWGAGGTKPPYDLDASVFVLDMSNGAPGVSIGNDYVCYYGQPKTKVASHLKGDNRDGSGDGADESILIELANAPANANFIACVISIYKAAANGQSFDQVQAPKATLFNQQTGEALATIEMSKLDAGSTGCLFAGLQRKDINTWEVVNVSQGFPKELPDFFSLYGVR